MKHTIQIFFFMLSFGIVSLGSANAQRTYTLDECLEQALSNNVRMKNAENNKKISAHDRKSAFTKYFPSVSATGAGFIANNGLFELQMSPEMQMSLMKMVSSEVFLLDAHFHRWTNRQWKQAG